MVKLSAVMKDIVRGIEWEPEADLRIDVLLSAVEVLDDDNDTGNDEISKCVSLLVIFIISWLMDLNFFLWNCQGTRHPRFHNFVVEYRREICPDAMYFFKTQVSGIRADGIIVKLGFFNSFRIETKGFSRGIWILCSDNVFVDILDLHLQVIFIRVRNRQGLSKFYVQ
ncbi:hypothetical protein PVK06_028092 [Gossypium arboreum]|uniref:Uncharacterized protein n=1 Tax=Gossypium arboreum TaxID=29729 RepID=A0ABR0P239_GOSAR|nr:hypothetical protein PVK06_028092 [Gossypium arboreum]